MHADLHSLERAIEEVSGRFAMQTRPAYANKPKRVALFVSKYDHCLHDLLWRHKAGELDAEFPLVREMCRQFGAEFQVFPITRETKREQERREAALRTIGRSIWSCWGRDLEQLVLARAVRSHLEDRILVYGNKTVVFD